MGSKDSTSGLLFCGVQLSPEQVRSLQICVTYAIASITISMMYKVRKELTIARVSAQSDRLRCARAGHLELVELRRHSVAFDGASCHRPCVLLGRARLFSPRDAEYASVRGRERGHPDRVRC